VALTPPPVAPKPPKPSEPPEPPEPPELPEPVKPPPPPKEVAPEPAQDRRTPMKKFHVIEQGAVSTFARVGPGEGGALPLDAIFADAGAIAPWAEIFQAETIDPAASVDRPGAALLMELKDSDGAQPSILLVDSAGVLTVVEESSDADSKAQRALIGKGINLAALLATEWTAETLQKEFKAYCGKTGRKPDDILKSAFGRIPPADFWKKVEGNLQAGRIRVLFLVREATVAIQKVIDFLFASTNMAAYALLLDVYQEQKAAKPRPAFAVKLYGPSKSARTARTAKSGADEPKAALDIVGS
jgi:hypothetical protein